MRTRRLKVSGTGAVYHCVSRTHGRVGTLWSERFKSVLVEGDVAALEIG